MMPFSPALAAFFLRYTVSLVVDSNRPVPPRVDNKQNMSKHARTSPTNINVNVNVNANANVNISLLQASSANNTARNQYVRNIIPLLHVEAC